MGAVVAFDLPLPSDLTQAADVQAAIEPQHEQGVVHGQLLLLVEHDHRAGGDGGGHAVVGHMQQPACPG